MEKSIFRTSGLERWSFALYMTGQAIINLFISTFYQLYLINVGISAYIVGVLFLVGRVWDAVNDPMFGALVDKVHIKGGRFLPWMRIANIVLPIMLVLLFAIPSNIPLVWKVFWAFTAYLGYDIAFTMCDVPIFAMTSAATDQVQERVNIMSRGTVLGTLGMVVASIVLPMVYTAIKPVITSFLIAAIVAILFFSTNILAKERFVNKDTEDFTLKMMLQYVKDNKYLRIGFLGIIVLSITNMSQTVLTFFAVYNLGSMEKLTTLMLLYVLPAMALGALMPTLTKKFDKFHLLLVGIIGQTVMSILSFIVGYNNQVLFFGMMLVRGIFYGIQLIIQLQFTGDFVEYGEYKTGKRLQGTAYSIQTLVFKFMNAVPAGAAMLILGAFGFKSGEGVVQPPSAISAIWILLILSPVVGAVMSLPIFAKYKLRDKTVQIMAAANSGTITREEADVQLAGKI